MPRGREEARRNGHGKEAGIRVAERKIEGRNRNESSDLKGKKGGREKKSAAIKTGRELAKATRFFNAENCRAATKYERFLTGYEENVEKPVGDV